MEKDYIAEHIGWLDNIFTNRRNEELFSNERQSLIQKQLSNRWVQENRLALLKEIVSEFGEDEVLAVIDKIIYTNCKKDWEQTGKEKDNSLDNFIKIIWEPLKKEGFEFSSEKKGNKTLFCVTKCPMYDLAKKLGAEKWMYHLICLTDGPSVTGFNSRIKFDRSRTLMQGHPDCDHCYTDLS
jgi:predicted ArsR family transcriptional regulator